MRGIIAFTDDDCLPAPGWLEALVDSLLRHATWCGVQGRTRAAAGPPDSHAIRVDGPNALYQTCNIAYWRDCLQAAGGFDLRFQGWFEDTALGARVRRLGEIGFEPGAVVTHQAVPRRPMDRASWRRLLEDERLLAREYRSFYRCTRGPGAVAGGGGTLADRLAAKDPSASFAPCRLGPEGFARLAGSLLHERGELLLAIIDVLRSDTQRKRESMTIAQVSYKRSQVAPSLGPDVVVSALRYGTARPHDIVLSPTTSACGRDCAPSLSSRTCVCEGGQQHGGSSLYAERRIPYTTSPHR